MCYLRILDNRPRYLQLTQSVLEPALGARGRVRLPLPRGHLGGTHEVVEGGVDHHHGLEVLGHLLVLGQAVEQLLLERVTPAEGAGGRGEITVLWRE
jgi:hypothetical protein